MYGTYTIGEIFKFMLKRCWIIAIAVVIGVFGFSSGGLQVEETNISINRLVEFENHATFTEPATGAVRYLNYNDVWFRSSVISTFIKDAGTKFEMEKFNHDWNSMDESAKIEWIKEVVTSSALANTPNYEFSLAITVGSGEKEYVQENAAAFVGDFVNYAVEATKFLSSGSTAIAKFSSDDISTDVLKSKAWQPQYIILGTLMGGMGSVLLLFVMFFFSRSVVSKSAVMAKYAPDFIEGRRAMFDASCYMMRQADKSGINVFTVSSAWNKQLAFNELLSEFKDSGMKIGVANLSGSKITVMQDNITVIPADAASQLLVPGKVRQAIETLKAGYEYLILLSPAPEENAVVAEQADYSACILFLEKLEKSRKKVLENSLQKLEDAETAVGVAWL